MRSFQQVLVLLFATLFALATADEMVYDTTVYITSTVYHVNTVTLSGYGTASLANSTSTISATGASYQPSSYVVPSASANGTAAGVYPSGTIAPSASAPAFTGAASQLNINAFVGALAAGMAYLAL
jgi:hypothetical protein